MNLDSQLGSYLTYHAVSLSRTEKLTLPNMLRQVRVQTAAHRATGGHFDSVVDMKCWRASGLS